MKWDLVRTPMRFPVENRPIWTVPVANMIRANIDVALPEMHKAIGLLCDAYPTERILVHCVSYVVAEALVGAARERGMWYRNAVERGHVIEMFEHTDGAVMFAPSLDRGWDGADDKARGVVVAKVPWPNLGDPQIAARMFTRDGQRWYAVQAVRTLVQMTGRGVRSADDWAHTYILDAQFRRSLYRRYKPLFPEWWRQAVSSTPPVQL